MKTLLTFGLAMAAGLLEATPSANNYHAVTNDWYNGNFSKVYELAQMRLEKNPTDIVGAHLMHDWALFQGDYEALSNAVGRLIAASDLVTEPALTNIYSLVRPYSIKYRDEILPEQARKDNYIRTSHSSPFGIMPGGYMLKLLWDKGLW